MERRTEDMHSVGGNEHIAVLLAELSSPDPAVRGHARSVLARLGTPAVAPLIQLLNSTSSDLRWEATNTLSHLGDPAATEALIRQLDDDRRGIRWLAANGLIAIGQSAILPLLRALIAEPSHFCLLEGAHHVLCALRTHADTGALGPVIKALEGPAPTLEAPLAAYHAIEELAPFWSLQQT